MEKRVHDDIDEARREAQALADRTKCHARVARVREYGRKRFVVRLVPMPKSQFGSDLEGELVIPGDPLGWY